MSEVININGTKYTEEDFNQEQSYFIKQIRSLKASEDAQKEEAEKKEDVEVNAEAK